MSTLPIQAPSVPQVWPVAGFSRILSALTTALDVFAEAHQQARVAHARFPFAEW